jgi:ribosomal protein S18 acetylase RimI-like enzyme
MPSKACDVTRVRLTLTAGIASHRQEVFALYKLSLYRHIEKAFGWEECAQRLRFDTVYRAQDYLQVMRGAEVVGHVVMKQGEEGAHLSLLLIKPEHQHQGIGQCVMTLLMAQADQAHGALTLSCFLSDKRAMGFYQRLGFTLMCTDEHFARYRYSAD